MNRIHLLMILAAALAVTALGCEIDPGPSEATVAPDTPVVEPQPVEAPFDPPPADQPTVDTDKTDPAARAHDSALYQPVAADDDTQLSDQRSCSKCGGSGRTDCTRCNGTGNQTCGFCWGSGSVDVTCRSCNGSGRSGDDLCGTCSGSRTVTEQCNNCGGRGVILCGSCNGQATEQCSMCGGTGNSPLR